MDPYPKKPGATSAFTRLVASLEKTYTALHIPNLR
jgi:hypothetical protein